MKLLGRELFGQKPDPASITGQILKRLDHCASPQPKIFWIELTSKCPFRCFFCMRKSTRREGEHMDFGLLQKILGQLDQPEIIRLNNAGESIHYPDLIEAVRSSKRTGARIELVTTLASAPMELLPKLVHSGLDQLTVSLHTVNPDAYRRIYGYASFSELDIRLKRLLQERVLGNSSSPAINISFVATKENLHALPQVSGYARRLGIKEIQVHRVICRDPESHLFDRELHGNRLNPVFRGELEEAVEHARRLFPELHLVYANNALDASIAASEKPAFYAEDLPRGCYIADCIENPWETLNIYANGDVVACGCRSGQESFGNLSRQSLDEIWHGPSFQRFREQYFLGLDESCCRCPWKKIFLPSGFDTELPRAGGWSWQLLRGWYHEEGAPAIWSKPEAIAFINSNVLQLRPKICIRGALPNPDSATENHLDIFCNGIPAGEVVNKNRGMLEFAENVPIPRGADPPYFLRFNTRKYYCPSEHDGSPDIRKLGFVLFRLSVSG